jgi:8-oxo-dGTP pyrophosphatase MutT (NUDIX family)
MTLPRPQVGSQRIPRPPWWRPGDPAPWATASSGGSRASGVGAAEIAVPDLAAVVELIRRRGPGRDFSGPAELNGGRPSAVLVALFEGERGPEVVLTRRPWTMRSHAGEVSFPGGGIDAGESAPDAALREAHEEVGLHPSAVEVVGELDVLATIRMPSRVVPVVGRLGSRPVLVPSPGEVDRAFTVALADLVVPGVYHSENWGPRPLLVPSDVAGPFRSGLDVFDSPAIPGVLHFFDVHGETIWGMTARVLTQLLSIVTQTEGMS